MHFFEARHCALALGGVALFSDLSFTVPAGLSLVRGGDGRGKTSLLRLIAGELAPDRGELRRPAASVFFERPSDPAHDAAVTREWIAARLAALPEADAAALPALTEAYGLAEHLDKPMFMLSTGSRRKAGLVAAIAGRAALTLLDQPFAALDAASGRRLAGWLRQAAAQRTRAVVVADHDSPPGLEPAQFAAWVDLGD